MNIIPNDPKLSHGCPETGAAKPDNTQCSCSNSTKKRGRRWLQRCVRRSFSSSFGDVHISISPSSSVNTRLSLLLKLPNADDEVVCQINHQMEKILSESLLKANLSFLETYRFLEESYNNKIKELHDAHKNA